ncbi:polysaccharide pyruvyl transferase family protein [Roseibium denhamense]|uniref:polysaccharide pyruvyl transferase family protein n=1 Tax=Roseibium denhamense TaxID=76305 RepID=UPI0024B7E46B|nr:polysaccharide pyruvyl transferase family protein [Roseibium denhamense]
MSTQTPTRENPRFLLINYTGDGYHWGCYATSHAITRNLLQKGPVDIISVSQNGQFKLGNVDLSQGYADAPGFAEKHPRIAEQILGADVVVVNGEGTLHGALTRGPIALLVMIRFAKAANKAVHLINHSCFPSDTTASCRADAAYVSILHAVDSVVVRDVASLAFYERNEIPAHLGFDCLPLYYEATLEDHNIASAPLPDITVIGGVTMSLDQVSKIIDILLARYGGNCKVTYLCGSAGSLAKEDKIAEHVLEQKYWHEERFQLVNARTFPEFMSHIRRSRLLVTGRFHYAIAAMSCGIPFIAYKSNTPKTEAVLNEHGYGAPILDPCAPISENLVPILDQFDSGGKALKTTTPLSTLVELANENFSFLHGQLAKSPPRSPKDILDGLEKSGHHRVIADYFTIAPTTQISISCRASIANSLYISKRYADALAQCDIVLKRQPAARGVVITRLKCLMELGQVENAMTAARSALERFPKAPGVLAAVAMTLQQAGDLQGAVAVAEQTLRINPQHKRALLIAARYYLTVAGDFQKATHLLRKYLTIDPENAYVNVQLGMALAQSGIDGEAFDHLSYRSEMPIVKLRHGETDYQLPKWDGLPTDGRLLVRPEPENGVGYEVLCATFIPELEHIGQSFSFAIQPRFRPFFESVFPHVDFVDVGNELDGKSYVAEVHFRDICKMRRRTRDDFAFSASHFARILEKPTKNRKLRVGLSWHTASIQRDQTAKRSIALSALAPLFETQPDRVQWVNLQYGDVDQEIKEAQLELGVLIEHQQGCDFVADNAALTAALNSVDIVVSIDNSTAFFAGLKQKPILLMVPHVSHWIWGEPDKTSRWLPCVDIVRQPSWGDWASVIHEVQVRLGDVLHEWKAPA